MGQVKGENDPNVLTSSKIAFNINITENDTNKYKRRIDMNTNELLTRVEAQQILKGGNNKMLELLHRKEFSFKIGNKWYCNKNLLLEWMDKQVLA